MKMFIRIMSVVLIIMMVLACGSSGGNGNNGDAAGKLTVKGNVYNQAVVVAGLDADIRVDAANTPSSILNAMAHDIERLSPISQSGTVMVKVEVKNLGPTLTDLSWFIGVEKDSFITLEIWECCECFYGPGVSACNESGGGNGWSTDGGYFYNTIESPGLPACDNSVTFNSGACHDVFPAVNCNTPSYEIKYSKPGNGLWMPSGSINSLKAGHTYYGYASTSLSAADIRDDKLAWIAVNSSEGNTLAEIFYLFDVNP